jgi:hypothetical protein
MAWRSRNSFAALALAIFVLTVAGCGGRTAYQVSGRAQYKDGSPLTGGVRIIRLEPTDDTTAEIRKVAQGTIADDGTFEMYTRKPGDGVIAGKYWVTFTVMDKPMGGKSLIPPEYTTGESSPFEIVVDDDKAELLFELEKL